MDLIRESDEILAFVGTQMEGGGVDIDRSL